VRVVWTSSLVVDLSAPKGGFDMIVTTKPPSDPPTNYNISKTGNWFLASALAAQAGRVDDGAILSVTQNPGNIKTSLLRHAPGLVKALVSTILHPARMGAYTELWAGLSEELTLEDGGGYVIPWGRRHPAPRSDLIKALKRKKEGGTGLAESFVEWCEQETKGFR
jgi:NAD(P)-dependent dehydrogenase (short-subunit alcohol dehydrogenase family)